MSVAGAVSLSSASTNKASLDVSAGIAIKNINFFAR